MIAVLLRQQEKEQKQSNPGSATINDCRSAPAARERAEQCNPGSATINDRRSAPAARERAETM